MSADAEYTRLWAEWLATEDGKSYQAGWGDYATKWHAERGRVWVLERIVGRLTAEGDELRKAHRAGTNYVADKEVEPTCVWFRSGRKVALRTKVEDGRIVRAWLDVDWSDPTDRPPLWTWPVDDYHDPGDQPEGDCPACEGTGEVCCDCDGRGCTRCLDGRRTCDGCDGSGYTPADWTEDD